VRARKKVWTTVSVIACVLVVFFGFRTYQQTKQERHAEIQTYNQWMNLMTFADSYLNSQGEGEKPRAGAFVQSPNAALFKADKYLGEANVLASDANRLLHGQAGAVDGELARVSQQLDWEVAEMYDYGTYEKGKYESTTPLKVLIADRDFMHTQITNVVLKGMPATVTNVGQINAQLDHLRSLQDVGVFSQTFEKFMEGTGQMTVAS
jgi:hypothetical protein